MKQGQLEERYKHGLHLYTKILYQTTRVEDQ